jgi:hypothetical protein
MFVSMAGSAEACCGGGGFGFLCPKPSMEEKIVFGALRAPAVVADKAVLTEQQFWSLIAEKLQQGLLGLVR